MTKIGFSFLSSTLMSLLLYPLDTAKRIYQMNGARGCHIKYDSQVHFLKEMLSPKQIPTLYRGVHIFAVKEVLVAFTQFSLYETLFLNGQ